MESPDQDSAGRQATLTVSKGAIMPSTKSKTSGFALIGWLVVVVVVVVVVAVMAN